MADATENAIQVLGQMAGQRGGGGHIERRGRHAGGIGVFGIQFERQHASVLAEFGRRVGKCGH